MKTGKHSGIDRRAAVAAIALAASGFAFAQQPSGQPIRIGSTLALTGPLSATAQIHKLVGEIYVEQLNKRVGAQRPGLPPRWHEAGRRSDVAAPSPVGAGMVINVLSSGSQPAPGMQFCGEWIESPCRWLL